MNKEEILEKVLLDIKNNVTQATYDSFISKVNIHNILDNPNLIELSTDKEFTCNILNKRYKHFFEESFKSIIKKNYRVVIKTSYDYEEKTKIIDESKKSTAFNLNFYSNKEKIFNPKFTFDNFVVGESNKFAYSACMSVAKTPSNAYNPLFIYGKSGLGKTHLMNAIGIYLLENNENMRILYVSSETFTNDFIKALQEGKAFEFKAKYRKADVLLVDDIQFLEGKEGIQEEFFHTFNALHEDNKQIILSGDRPPNKLVKLDERLRSRFGWNIIAEIAPPDYETRIAILRKKAEILNVEVDSDVEQVISIISEKIKDNIRELEGAFTRIHAFSQMYKVNIDMTLAKRYLKDIISIGGSVTPEKIKSTISKHYKIKISDLESDSRKSTFAYPRQIAMYLCRTSTDYSLPRIGKIFGGKHYSTVKHACDKIEDELKHNKELKEEISKIKEELDMI
ncbi:MAG: chromosomal replication initiator protein DnaA [Eubacterium sp.]|nr:chromosomal replication initiator protein DnaA [Eubacterium sp.]